MSGESTNTAFEITCDLFAFSSVILKSFIDAGIKCVILMKMILEKNAYT